jgi:hypothetical protein
VVARSQAAPADEHHSRQPKPLANAAAGDANPHAERRHVYTRAIHAVGYTAANGHAETETDGLAHQHPDAAPARRDSYTGPAHALQHPGATQANAHAGADEATHQYRGASAAHTHGGAGEPTERFVWLAPHLDAYANT